MKIGLLFRNYIQNLRRETKKNSGAIFIWVAVIALALLLGVFRISFVDTIASYLFNALAILVNAITKLVNAVFIFLSGLVADTLDVVSQFNPFDTSSGLANTQARTGIEAPAITLWKIIKTISYVFLVFFALISFFLWIKGDDHLAQKQLFNIIIVALFINFSFFLVREVFSIAWVIEKKITSGINVNTPEENSSTTGAGIGTFLYASFLQIDFYGKTEAFIKSLYQEKKVSVPSPKVSNSGVLDSKTADMEGNFVTPLLEILAYFSNIAITLLIFIVLCVFTIFYFVRYIVITWVASISSLAFASYAFPKFEGVLGQSLSGFSNFFDMWFRYFIKWTTVMPTLIFLVLLGVIIQTNILPAKSDNINLSSNINESLVQFVSILLFLIIWYVYAIIIASGMSNGLAKIITFAVLNALGSIGMLTAKKTFNTVGKPPIGRMMLEVGNRLSESDRVKKQNWLSRRLFNISEKLKEMGESYLGERIKSDTDYIRRRVGGIIKNMEDETDPRKINQFTQELNNLMQSFKTNGRALTEIASLLRGLDANKKIQILQNSNLLSSLNEIASNQKLPPVVKNALFGSLAQDLQVRHVLDLLKNDTIATQLPNELIQRMSQKSQNVFKNINSLIEQVNKSHGIDQTIINYLSDREEILEEIDSFNQLLNSRKIDLNNRKQIISNLIGSSLNRSGGRKIVHVNGGFHGIKDGDVKNAVKQKVNDYYNNNSTSVSDQDKPYFIAIANSP